MITKNAQRMQTGWAGTDNVIDMLCDWERAADCDAQYLQCRHSQNKFYWISDRSMVAHLNYTDTQYVQCRHSCNFGQVWRRGNTTLAATAAFCEDNINWFEAIKPQIVFLACSVSGPECRLVPRSSFAPFSHLSAETPSPSFILHSNSCQIN